MNDSTPTTPRVICRISRRWNAIVGDPSSELILASRHVRNCDDCQRFYRASIELETALFQDAPRKHRSPPVGLDQRIIDSIALSARPSRRSFRRIPAIAFAGGVAGIALGGLLLNAYLSPSTPQRSEVVGNGSSSGNSSDLTAPDLLWNSLPPASTLLAQNPLQDEVDAVYSDARSAVRFLAMNFLPEAPESVQGTRDVRRPGSSDG